VPDVTGKDQDEAIPTLESAGFVTEVVTEATEDPTQVGIVQSTSPASGSQRVGSTITVTVGEFAGDAGDTGGVPPVE
jgi:beta-lactam-binding protein with PASTA domain